MDIKTLCLGLLTMGEASGYEIKKFFEDGFSHFYVAGFGSIYPALAALTREGLAQASSVEQSGRPAKKVYRITDAGRVRFSTLLAESYPDHRVRSDFLVMMIFSSLLGREGVARVFEQRLGDIEAELAHIAHCRGGEEALSSGAEFVVGYARAVLEAGREYIENHREAFLQGFDADVGGSSNG